MGRPAEVGSAAAMLALAQAKLTKGAEMLPGSADVCRLWLPWARTRASVRLARHHGHQDAQDARPLAILGQSDLSSIRWSILLDSP